MRKHTVQDGLEPEMEKRIIAAVRLRPPFDNEIIDGDADLVHVMSSRGVVQLNGVPRRQREFYFDHAFGADATQDDLFVAVGKPIVEDVLQGCNGAIVAFGQTGSGKTHTMGILEEIKDEHAGIIPRAIARIFDHVDEQLHSGRIEVIVTMSFLQLYCDTIQDLLVFADGNGNNNNHRTGGRHYNHSYSPTSSRDGGLFDKDNSSNRLLVIREDPLTGFYVEGLTEYRVNSYAEAEVLVNLGLEGRALAATLMNATSSRSHTILTLRIDQRTAPTAQNGHRSNTHTSQSSSSSSSNPNGVVKTKLVLVDLAGSERVRRSSSFADTDTVTAEARFAEAKSINSSLSALGGVISALVELSHHHHHHHHHQQYHHHHDHRQTYSSHVPYRDSKLTRLLQDSIGGTARTALIATIGPSRDNYSETLSTLSFAARCMNVKVRHPAVSATTDDLTDHPTDHLFLTETCARLQSHNLQLQAEVSRQRRLIHNLHAQLLLTERGIRLPLHEGDGDQESTDQPAGLEGGLSAGADLLSDCSFDFATLEQLIDQLSDIRLAAAVEDEDEDKDEDVVVADAAPRGRSPGNHPGSADDDRAAVGVQTVGGYNSQVMMTPIVAAAANETTHEYDDFDEQEEEEGYSSETYLARDDEKETSVDGPINEKAMVLSRIAALTVSQIRALSPTTRSEVLHIRREILGMQ